MDKRHHLTTDQQFLFDISRQLLSCENVQQTADTLVEALFAKIQSFDCAFFRFEPTHHQLICISYASRESQGLESFKLKPIPLNAGVVGHVAAEQQAKKIDHCKDCDYWLNYVEGNVSELTVPIVYDGTLLGVIDLEDERESYFSEDDLELVQEAARLMAKFVSQQMVNEDRLFKLEQLDYSERRAKNKESYFSMLLEQLGDPVFIINTSGKILDVNPSAVLSLGFSKKELVGQHIQKVEQITGNRSSIHLYKNIRQNDAITAEGIHTRKDGTRFYVEIKMASLEDGNIIAVARDISMRRKVLQDLQNSQQFLQEVIKTSPDVIYAYDFKLNKIMIGGPRLACMLGYPANEFDDAQRIMELLHPDDVEAFKDHIREVYYSPPGKLTIAEARLQDAAGKYHWLQSRSLVFKRDDEGQPISKLGTVRDITDKRQLKTELARRDNYYQALVENAFDGIVLYDIKGQVKFCSGSAMKLVNYTEDEALTMSGLDFIHEEDQHLAKEAWQWLLHHPGQVYRIPDYRILKRNGDIVWVENTLINLLDDPNVQGIISNFRDISYKKLSEQSLYKISNYDSLTELPNRAFLKRQLERFVVQADKYQHQLRLIYFDVIQLSMINNAWGRLTGDHVLQYIVQILQSHTDDYDFIARAGDDEFAVVLRQKDSFEASKLVESILTHFDSVISLSGADIKVSLRAGIIRFPEDARKAEELLNKAEVTARRVRKLPTPFAFYQAKDTEAARNKLILEKDLVRALNNDELMLHYQPKVCLNTGTIDSVEALLRWQHPTKGFIPPNLIISIAEESSLIFRLTDWVVTQAIKQVRQWQDEGLKIKVSVNLSVKDLMRDQLQQNLDAILSEYNIAPELLDLEITESAALMDKERSVRLLDKLCKMGVSISLDDFGTGYSSISYLTLLPVSLVKIDQSFIRNTAQPEDNAQHDNRVIIKNIIRLARSFNMRSLVEGVETVEQLKLLQEYGCDLAQGYLFSQPMSAEALKSLLQSGHIELLKLTNDSVASQPLQ